MSSLTNSCLTPPKVPSLIQAVQALVFWRLVLKLEAAEDGKYIQQNHTKSNKYVCHGPF